jgi:hypothetical protein
MTATEIVNADKNFQKNRYFPMTYTEYWLGRFWLRSGISRRNMDDLIEKLICSRPDAQPRNSKKPFLDANNINVQSTAELQEMILMMPEGCLGGQWLRQTLRLEGPFAFLNSTSVLKSMVVDIPENPIAIFANLFGGFRFKGVIYTHFKEERDESTTWVNPQTRVQEHPRVYSNAHTADAWREAEVSQGLAIILTIICIHFIFTLQQCAQRL